MNMLLILGIIWGVSILAFALFLLVLKGGKVESRADEFERIIIELSEEARGELIEFARQKLNTQGGNQNH
jgi:hypothetical protein